MAPESNLTMMEHEALLYWRSANSAICFTNDKESSINSREEAVQARREIKGIAAHSRWPRLRNACCDWLTRHPGGDEEAVA